MVRRKNKQEPPPKYCTTAVCGWCMTNMHKSCMLKGEFSECACSCKGGEPDESKSTRRTTVKRGTIQRRRASKKAVRSTPTDKTS